MIAFELDDTFWLNLVFVAVAGVLLWLHARGGRPGPTAARSRTEPAPAAR